MVNALSNIVFRRVRRTAGELGRTLHIFLAVVLILTAEVPRAEGAQVSLLMLKDLQQSLSLSYAFSGQQSRSDLAGTVSSNSHLFEEEYDIVMRYAIYSPRLLNGRFKAGLLADENFADSTPGVNQDSSRQNFTYNLTGTLLPKSSIPVTFFSSTGIQHVSQAFAPTYTLQTDSLGATLSITNKLLPAAISYSRITTKTSGQSTDSESVGESLGLSASHSYKVSQTSAGIFFTTSETSAGGAQGVSSINGCALNIQNILRFDRGRLSRNLSTTYRYDEQAGTFNSRSSSFDQFLQWDLGKALKATLRYQNLYNNFDGQRAATNSGDGTLQHMLFQSLATQLTGHATQTTFASGTLTVAGGGGGLDYIKKLSAGNSLKLGFHYNHDVVDNALRNGIIFVTNEQHTVPALPPFEIALNNVNVLPQSIVVRTGDRLFTYTAGTDYTVQTDGTITKVVIAIVPTPGPFPINAGTPLSIDYQYRTNSESTYASDSYNADATLSLLNNRHRIFARMTDTSQTLIKGNAATFAPNDFRTYLLGFETNLEPYFFGASYQRYESPIDTSQGLSGFCRYAREFGSSSVRLSARDVYLLYGTSGAGGASTNYANTFTADAELQTWLLRLISTKLTSRYLNASGRARYDQLSVNANFSAQLGRTELALLTEVDWRFAPGVFSQGESVYIRVTRSF